MFDESKNSILAAFISVIMILCVTLCGCADTKIAVGKYYMANNTESYIEIIENNKILFVNVDFSVFDLEAVGSSMTVDEVVEKLGQPLEYDYYNGSSMEGYDYTIQILIGVNDQGIEFCLTLRWSKTNKLWCLNNVYKLAN